LFIAYDAVEVASQTCVIDGDTCPVFDRWTELETSNDRVDFRRIQKVGSGLRLLQDYVVDLLAFEEGSMIDESNGVRNKIYHRVEDQLLVFVKSVGLSANVQQSRMESELENLINLRHLCIACPIGFVFGIESGNRKKLKIVRLYLEGCSLAEVLSVRPVWWTSTVKAKVYLL
jgi:hypothetical protein